MAPNDDVGRLWAVVAEQGAEVLRLRTELAATQAQLAAMSTEVHTGRIVVRSAKQSTVIEPGWIELEHRQESPTALADGLGRAPGSRVELTAEWGWSGVVCSADVGSKLPGAPVLEEGRYVALLADAEMYDPPRVDVVLHDNTERPGRDASLRAVASADA